MAASLSLESSSSSRLRFRPRALCCRARREWWCLGGWYGGAKVGMSEAVRVAAACHPARPTGVVSLSPVVPSPVTRRTRPQLPHATSHALQAASSALSAGDADVSRRARAGRAANNRRRSGRHAPARCPGRCRCEGEGEGEVKHALACLRRRDGRRMRKARAASFRWGAGAAAHPRHPSTGEASQTQHRTRWTSPPRHLPTPSLFIPLPPPPDHIADRPPSYC